jgi:uncharacterized protein YjbI with pentapeptide repeats
MQSSNREHHIDQVFDSDVDSACFSNRLFNRIAAKNRRFTKVDFKYTIFDACYFRNCVFDSCDFTGCRFSGTNLIGSKFDGCTFDYVLFERTQVDNVILDVGCPGWENLALRFARTLRTNYQGLGDVASANKALAVELHATEVHLRKAWISKESYYRKKFKGLDRIRAFFEWSLFKGLDFAWGNGENVWKLIRTVLTIWLVMAIVHVICLDDSSKIASYWTALLKMPEVFLGVTKPMGYSDFFITFILFVRLVVFGLFMSIIVKRFSRR